ncbi:GSCOCG00000248001-RA-CDS, partial [Cotesia congregata]
CTWLYQQTVKKIDYDPYSYLLNDIRADELSKKCVSTLLYVIQEPEMYHLVKNIWHGRSIVSEVDDIYRLRLVRFHVDREWAPWNCILLTEEESKAHYYITDLCSVYSKQLLYKIYLIHQTARSHFHMKIYANSIVKARACARKFNSSKRLLTNNGFIEQLKIYLSSIKVITLASKIAAVNNSGRFINQIYFPKFFVIDIVNNEENKKLGKWKNIITGKEYLDAATQASTRHRSSFRNILTVNRVTQTPSFTACKYTSAFYDKTIQTSILPDLSDKLLTPSSAARNRLTTELHRECSKNSKIFPPPVKDKLVRLNEDKRFEIVERRTPRTRSDFEMLHNMLDRWRVLESEQVDCVLFGNSLMAAKSLILLKEIELLRSIELSKSKVREELKERRNLEFLDKLAMLECWRTRDGKLIKVETQRVARARKCRSLYLTLMQVDDTTGFGSAAGDSTGTSVGNSVAAGRIDTLENIKKLIYGHTCQPARELEYLVDQEIEFTRRNFDYSVMSQLKNRIKLAFLKFTTLYCQEESYYEYHNRDIMTFCRRCGKLLPITESSEDEPSVPTCSSCISMRPSKNPKILYEPYEQMLKDLRKSEAQMGLFDGLAFHIDPRVLHQLVNYIWHGKSGISEFDDLFQLRLLRFRREVEWSPWNSVLLTKREAAVHQAVANPWDLYEASLVQKFLLRNLQAKLYFNYLVK